MEQLKFAFWEMNIDICSLIDLKRSKSKAYWKLNMQMLTAILDTNMAQIMGRDHKTKKKVGTDDCC